MDKRDKSYRANASQFFVAGELCRRGYSAVITLGNTPNTDILCSNVEGTKFVHIQVKTFLPKSRTCSVGMKAEKYYGENFIWVISGIPDPKSKDEFEYFIVPSKIISKAVSEGHSKWKRTPGVKGQPHRDTKVRTIPIPPYTSSYDEINLENYRNRWDLIEEKLKE